MQWGPEPICCYNMNWVWTDNSDLQSKARQKKYLSIVCAVQCGQSLPPSSFESRWLWHFHTWRRNSHIRGSRLLRHIELTLGRSHLRLRCSSPRRVVHSRQGVTIAMRCSLYIAIRCYCCNVIYTLLQYYYITLICMCIGAYCTIQQRNLCT